MAHKIEIDYIDDIVWVTSSGETEFDRNTQAIEAAATLAKEKHTECIVFDIRDAVYKEFHVSGIKHAAMAHELGMKSEFKIGLLGTESQTKMLQYYEHIAFNYGITAKRFTDESRMLEWLKQPL